MRKIVEKMEYRILTKKLTGFFSWSEQKEFKAFIASKLWLIW